MSIERLNPLTLHATPGYHHVTVVPTGRLAILAGQCPLLLDGTVVGAQREQDDTDLDIALVQTDQIVANTLVALASVNATSDDVVKTTIYVVTTDHAVLGGVWNRLTTSAIGAAFSTASTLVGVAQLGFMGQLVELDVIAALE